MGMLDYRSGYVSWNAIRRVLRECGMACMLCITPCGMYLNYFLGGEAWSNVVAVVSVALVANWRNVVSLRFPSRSNLFILFSLFFLVCLFYALASGFKGMEKVIYFLLFSFCAYVAFMSTSVGRDFDLDEFLWVALLLSSSLALLNFYCLVNGLIVDYGDVEAMKYEDRNILERFTMSSGSVVNVFVALWAYRRRCLPDVISWVLLLLVLIDFYVILAFGKRTPLVVSFVSTAVFVFWGNLSFKINWRVIVVAFVAIPLLDSDLFSENFDSFKVRFVSGVSEIFTGEDVGDVQTSGLARYELRKRTWRRMASEFSFLNYVFGKGYNSLGQIDNPLLQAYFEMGLVGFGAVLWSVLMPFVLLFGRWRRLWYIQFAAMCPLYQALAVFNSGNPYFFGRWSALGVCLFIVANVRKVEREAIKEASFTPQISY